MSIADPAPLAVHRYVFPTRVVEVRALGTLDSTYRLEWWVGWADDEPLAFLRFEEAPSWVEVVRLRHTADVCAIAEGAVVEIR